MTSLSTRVSGSAVTPERSTRAIRARPPAPCDASAPSAVRKRPPRARSMPTPPSVDALDPMPRMSRVAPASTAALIASPNPCVWADRGRNSSPRSSIPEVDASSTTAVPSGNQSHSASTARSCGPMTRTGTRLASGKATANASSVPSPPSAMGTGRTSSSGLTRLQPAARCVATEAASRDCLKLSGATTTVVMSGARVCFRAAGRSARRGRRRAPTPDRWRPAARGNRPPRRAP